MAAGNNIVWIGAGLLGLAMLAPTLQPGVKPPPAAAPRPRAEPEEPDRFELNANGLDLESILDELEASSRASAKSDHVEIDLSVVLDDFTREAPPPAPAPVGTTWRPPRPTPITSASRSGSAELRRGRTLAIRYLVANDAPFALRHPLLMPAYLARFPVSGAKRLLACLAGAR